MKRDQPEYLAKLPKDRQGIVWVVVIGLAIATSLAGAFQVYIGTVDGWNKRFGENAREQPQVRATVERAGEPLILPAPILQPKAYDKCINGTPFKKLPDGGWENVPGVRCYPNPTN